MPDFAWAGRPKAIDVRLELVVDALEQAVKDVKGVMEEIRAEQEGGNGERDKRGNAAGGSPRGAG
ncbi:MAG TPA: hypothetical protein VFR23_17790 [Jiangellaceae bacterium]|nr:hypothetical protein [Jiangellaceae bacterium]